MERRSSEHRALLIYLVEGKQATRRLPDKYGFYPTNMTPARRLVPFPDRKAGRAFNNKFTELVKQLLRRVVDSRISPENAHAFYHGQGWTQRRSDGSDMTTAVKGHSAETELKFDDVVGGKVFAITEQIRSIIAQMEDGFMRSLYETVSEAVEEVGNVVDAKGKPPTEAYLEMLRMIEFGVNRKGEVTRPEIHTDPETAPKLMKALEDAGPEFHAEVDRVMAEKDADALFREEKRKARFKGRAEGT